VAVACAPTAEVRAPTLVGEALLEPASCLPCHAEHFREWSGSMHAYAGEDPVFVAMNRRLQRETNGQGGAFCVGCHAPMAVRLGKTRDGLNLASLPPQLRGVTCFFCHTTSAVAGTHDNPLQLAGDELLRGGLGDPLATSHKAGYSALHDRERPESAVTCGSCHDVVTPLGAHIERTLDEWQRSLFSKPGQPTCGKCHMPGRDGLAAAVDGAPRRTVHDHTMPGVDVALTPFPEAPAQRAAIQGLLDATLLTKLCVRQTPQAGLVAEVTLDNAFAGHSFPSGVAHDRRAWLELVAYRGGAPVFTSGVVADKVAVTSIVDPNLWLLRDRLLGPDGKEVRMFWEAAGYESHLLPAAVTADRSDPAFVHSVTRTYPLPSPAPDRVTVRVRLRPIDFDVLEDLVRTGDLEASALERVPTFDLGNTVREWSSAGGLRCVE
jgi:hypothetical protein